MIKRLKPVVVFATTMALALPLAGCGEATPAEVVDTALTSIQLMDGTTLATVYSGGKLDKNSKDIVGMLSTKDDIAMSPSIENLSSGQQGFVSDTHKKLCSFDYTINSTAIDNSTAKVNVTFKTFNFGSAYEDGMEGFGEGFITSVSNGSDKSGEMTKALIARVQDEVNALDSKNKSKTIDLSLKRVNGVWMLDELSKDQLDAMFGGIVSAFR